MTHKPKCRGRHQLAIQANYTHQGLPPCDIFCYECQAKVYLFIFYYQKCSSISLLACNSFQLPTYCGALNPDDFLFDLTVQSHEDTIESNLSHELTHCQISGRTNKIRSIHKALFFGNKLNFEKSKFWQTKGS